MFGLGRRNTANRQNNVQDSKSIPVAVRGDHIVDFELLGNFFDAKMQGVGLELLAGHVGENGSRQAHEAGCLVLGRLAPARSLRDARRCVFVLIF